MALSQKVPLVGHDLPKSEQARTRAAKPNFLCTSPVYLAQQPNDAQKIIDYPRCSRSKPLVNIWSCYHPSWFPWIIRVDFNLVFIQRLLQGRILRVRWNKDTAFAHNLPWHTRMLYDNSGHIVNNSQGPAGYVQRDTHIWFSDIPKGVSNLTLLLAGNCTHMHIRLTKNSEMPVIYGRMFINPPCAKR